MTYRDIPILRSTGWKSSVSGYSWFGTDKDGNEWQASDDEDTSNLLTFRMLHGPSMRMDREKFSELFE
jgi:hypothetical protein